MAERSKAYAWRAYDEHNSSVGSNPTLSARKPPVFLTGFFLGLGSSSRPFLKWRDDGRKIDKHKAQ